MEKFEIKPCPFCGGYATISKNSKTVVRGELKHTTYCYCTVCKSRGQRFLLDDFLTRADAREFAIEAWNRRADD